MSRFRSIKRITPLLALLCVASLLSASASLLANASAAGTTTPPVVTTAGVNNVRGTSATLNGTVNPGGLAAEYFFQYGPTLEYGSESTVKTLAAGTLPVKVGTAVVGLQPNWHYRLVAVNSLGTVPGKDHVYTIQLTKLKVGVDKPTGQHNIGGSLTITGTLTGAGAPNHAVVLQASPYPYTQPFVNVTSSQIASATGRYSFTVSKLTSSSEYRVATLDPRPIYSASVTALVSPKITLHVRTSSHKGIVRLYGTVSPAISGAKVFFQLAKPQKDKIFKSEKAEERAEEKGPHYASQFGTTVKHATGSFSRFSAIEKISKAGRYRAYVVVKKPGLVSGYSTETVVLKAAPGAQKKHHHHKH
jgi:hypothetical protein